MKRFVKVLMGVVAAGAVSFTLLAGGRRAAVPASSRATDAEAATTAATVAPGRVGAAPTPSAARARRLEACAPQRGSTAGRRLRGATTFASPDGLPRSPSDPSSVQLEAELQLESLGGASGRTVILARWVGTSEGLRRGAGELETPFLFELDEACTPVRFARAKTTPLASARAQQAAIWELSFRVPSADGETWTGGSGAGRFDAVAGLDEGGRVVQRRVVAYHGRDVTAGDNVLSAWLDEQFWFSRLEARATSKTAGLPEVSTTMLVESTSASPAALADASRSEIDYVWEDVLEKTRVSHASTAPRTAEEASRAAELSRASYEDAMVRFIDTARATTDIVEQERDLSLYLESRPDTLPLLAGHLRSQLYPDRLRPTLFMAIGQARTPSARTTLRELVGDAGLTPIDRVRAAVALAGRADTDVEDGNTLVGLADAGLGSRDRPTRFVAENALLAAGMLAAVSGDGTTAAKVRSLATALLSSDDQPTRRIGFRAIGNLGDPSDLDLVARWSRSRDVDARADACRALRRLALDLVADFELEWLRRETAPDVMGELWYVLMEQLADDADRPLPEPFVALAVAHLKLQLPVQTRQTLLKLLTPLMADHPEVRLAVVAQAAIEFETRSGMFSFVARFLTEDEFKRATLAGMAARRAASPDAPGSAWTDVAEPVVPDDVPTDTLETP